MIGYLEGSILHFESDGILLLAGHVGYEIFLNPQVLEKIRSQNVHNDIITLYIYYHQTERQPKPVLIGFQSLEEKAFFQEFITVDAIGPMKAVKAMSRSITDIALAIEKKDTNFLAGLNGIGKRTAEKIIATLNGKVERFISAVEDQASVANPHITDGMQDICRQVEDVLVEQLGHSPASAKRMVKEAFERNGMISTPEELFDEIYRENG
ncbi:MAG: ATP-dependent DNA helicase RuvA [Desulfobacterales bacterium RIFOXYA12_FULL_46_15]|nr:MAG: ATP-dependent DNA helicase RuvA [Desulfobacula sp. GWF2_41_7]OGR26888.1 MAG: ATP-dependent DNA helicase RuvA [Desulfobacterales bacterium RIFOXYA12_FULL_46_15]